MNNSQILSHAATHGKGYTYGLELGRQVAAFRKQRQRYYWNQGMDFVESAPIVHKEVLAEFGPPQAIGGQKPYKEV